MAQLLVESVLKTPARRSRQSVKHQDVSLDEAMLKAKIAG